MTCPHCPECAAYLARLQYYRARFDIPAVVVLVSGLVIGIVGGIRAAAINDFSPVILVGMVLFVSSILFGAIIPEYLAGPRPHTGERVIDAPVVGAPHLSIEEVDHITGTTLPALPPEQRNLINMALKAAVSEGLTLSIETVVDTLRTAVPEVPAEHLHVLRMALTYYLKEKQQ